MGTTGGGGELGADFNFTARAVDPDGLAMRGFSGRSATERALYQPIWQ